MYMHYCKRCHRVYMLNGHKQKCPNPQCKCSITELKIPYMDYVSMNQEARAEFCNCCADEEQLQKLSTTYRMFKYSKWYKKEQAQELAQKNAQELTQKLTQTLAQKLTHEQEPKQHQTQFPQAMIIAYSIADTAPMEDAVSMV